VFDDNDKDVADVVVDTLLDYLLKSHFGHAFEGVDIKKIMAKSDDLFGVGGMLRRKLLQHTSNPDKVVIVNKVCGDVGLAFKLWDGAFLAIHSPNPTVEHCTVTLT
jgi:hypothetical protein